MSATDDEWDASDACWSDAELLAMSWVNEGRDLELRLRMGVGSGDVRQVERTLVCGWVSELQVDLRFPEGHGGYPLTWETTFEEGEHGDRKVVFDFGGRGEIRFKCSDVSLIPDRS